MSKNDTTLEFERTLLATMMLRPADCWRVDLQPEHCVSEQHGEILAAIRALSADSQPVDPLTVSEYLESLRKPVIAKLAITVSNAVTTVAPEAYAQKLLTSWRERKAADIGAALVSRSVNVDTAIADLMSLHATEQKHEFTAKEAARAALTELTRIHESGGKLPGITTGLKDIDDKLGGLHAGDLIVIGGRAAMGKTAFMIGLASAGASAGNPVGMISGEQPVEQVSLRMVAGASHIDAKRFRTADFDDAMWARAFGGFEKISTLPIWFLDRSSPTMAEVVRVARRWVHQHGIKALYVDYLQRVIGEGDTKAERVGNVAKGLKNLARDLNIPVVVLAQINREAERGGKAAPPQLGHLADSDEIGREADQVLMIFREGYYDDNAPQGVAQIVVEKNRHGPTGTVNVSWVGETMTFHDLAFA